MQIIRGKIPCAKKVVVYGPEGIGKSTFASQFPDPVFIDTEGSTKDMDVARYPKATSWQMLLEQLTYTKNNPTVCKTLVIDTIDWAEQMCIEAVCAKHHKSGIEEFGYGNGYVYVKEEFGRFLNQLSEVIEAGVNVVLTAHAQIRKFEQPDEMGAYDRYELKLGKKTASQTSPLVKEWADMLLFANYKTYSVSVDEKGKKNKAQGGKRVMYTQHHPCWDAKNRYGLAEELPFEYGAVAHIFSGQTQATQNSYASVPVQQSPQPVPETNASVSKTETESTQETKEQNVPTAGEQMTLPINQPESPSESLDPGIPKALRDLMEMHHVCEWHIQNVVAARGYFPADMQVKDYPPDFIEGVLIGAWPQVHAMVKEMIEKQEIPFD